MWKMTPEEIEEQEQIETMWKAQDAMRKYMPYGLFVNAENNKVLLFNREYEVMEFAGQREFDLDLGELFGDFTNIMGHRFLMTDDGHEYVGTMLWLYEVDPPYYFEKDPMIAYFLVVEKVISQIIKCPGNSFNEQTASKKQKARTRKLLKKYYPTIYSKK